MKKLVLFLLLILFSQFPVFSAVVEGGIEYNQEIARGKVFREPSEKINFELIKSKYTDNQREYNLNALSTGNTKLSDREIGNFSDGTYGIMFYDDPEYYWFYSAAGKLISFTKKSSLNYPIKITRYSPQGNIINTGLKISETESYIFSPDKKLIAHWIGNLCYDSNNNVIMTRSLIKQ